jgi:hypothetical protein
MHTLFFCLVCAERDARKLTPSPLYKRSDPTGVASMDDSRRRAAALMNRLRTDGFQALHSSDNSAGIPRSAQRGFGLVLDAATMTITEVRGCVRVSGTVRVRVRERECVCTMLSSAMDLVQKKR